MVTPKATMKLGAAFRAASPEDRRGEQRKNSPLLPSVAPTSALTPTRRLNWARFA
jgi:hypothetical protein